MIPVQVESSGRKSMVLTSVALTKNGLWAWGPFAQLPKTEKTWLQGALVRDLRGDVLELSRT